MKNYQVIKVQYLGPTNARGSRVKLTDYRFNKSKTIPYSYEHNNTRDIAIDWLTREGHKVVGQAEVSDHYLLMLDAQEGSFKSL